MPELPDVAPGEIIASAHINDIRDRTVQRYATDLERDTDNPTPTSGDVAWVEESNALQVFNGAVWGSRFSFQDGNAANPAVKFVNAPTSGFSRLPTGEMVVVYASTVGISVEALGDVYLPEINNFTTGQPANVFAGASGRMQVSTSARKYKSNIVDASDLATLPLEPVSFHHDGDDKDYLGFIADDLADQDARLGQYGDDGQIENYDLRGVVAVLAAKVNLLTTRLEALEG